MTAHRTWQGGFLPFQHRWGCTAMCLPYFSEYPVKKLCNFINPIHFYHTLETSYYLINGIIRRNTVGKESEANANAILGRVLKKRRTTRSIRYASSSQWSGYGTTITLDRQRHIFWQPF